MPASEPKKKVVLVFEVHQPFRLRKRISRDLLKLAVSGRANLHSLEKAILDEDSDRHILERICKRCYGPALKTIISSTRGLMQQGHEFRVGFSVSGTLLEQLDRWRPDVIELFKELTDIGGAEFICEPYYHSLVSCLGDDEFVEQLKLNADCIKTHIGFRPVAAVNTEMIFSNKVALAIRSAGFDVSLIEGVEDVLKGGSPNHVYTSSACDLRLLVRNYTLTDDVAFRFSERSWNEFPLTATKFSSWLRASPGQVITLFMDFETFGEHHSAESGIIDFLSSLPSELVSQGFSVPGPRRAAKEEESAGIIDVPDSATISWADVEKDLSAWLGNELQKETFTSYSDLEPYVKATESRGLIRLWRILGEGDHYYYMASKTGPSGGVHSYFSPYKSAVQAFKSYTEALTLLHRHLANAIKNSQKYAKKIRLGEHSSFRFYLGADKPLQVSAASLSEFTSSLSKIPAESVAHHILRGDIQLWIRDKFFLDELAQKLDGVAALEKPEEVLSEVNKIMASFMGIKVRFKATPNVSKVHE